MKRFVCAIIMLALIILLTASVNVYLIGLSDKMIELSSSGENAEEIKEFWQSKKIWFSVFLPHEQIKDVSIGVEELDSADKKSETIKKIKTSSEDLKDNLKFSAENIF